MNSQFNPEPILEFNPEDYKNISLSSSSRSSSSLSNIFISLSNSNANISVLHTTPQRTMGTVFQSTTNNILKKIDSQNIFLGKQLNKGSFSVVYEAELKEEWQSKKVAVKINNKLAEGKGSEAFENEMKIAGYLQQPFVKNYPLVKTLGFTSDGIVMELMAKGDICGFLSQKVKTNFDTSRIMMDFLLAVDFMHFYGVIHRDIKSDNIMLDENMHAKLGDFGFSVISSDLEHYEDIQKYLTGTVGYIAPELILADVKNLKKPYSPKSDVYALGITAFEILTCEYAYHSLNTQEKLEATIEEKKRPVIPEKIHPNLRFFIQKAWSADPEKRPTSSQAVHMLEEHYKEQAKTLLTSSYKS